jgi:hypothetical protein
VTQIANISFMLDFEVFSSFDFVLKLSGILLYQLFKLQLQLINVFVLFRYFLDLSFVFLH